MPFPIRVGDRELPDPPSLAALVRADAGPASGTVVPGQRPNAWIVGLVDAGALERRLAIGLAAALLQHPEAATVCEGARLAERLGERLLGGVIVRALAAHDTALLLQVDPGGAGESVEDTLLRVAPRLADLSDPAVRRPLLERLRHAGLPAIEVPLLCEHGDAEDLRTWLPAVLAEGVGVAELDALGRRLLRDDDGAAVIRELLTAAG